MNSANELWSRRRFCAVGAAAAAAALVPQWARARADDASVGEVMTVTGPVAAEEIGVTLMHEHLLVDFIGADRVSRDRYDAKEVIATMAPQLDAARKAGCQTLVECTPAYLGRDPQLLRELSKRCDLRLVTCTGYYGAVSHKFLPEHAFSESADELAARWIAEFENGIEGTDVRPGIIKIGVDAGPLSEVNRKLVQAAAKTHQATGLRIAAHTGDGRAALEQIEILEMTGASPAAWIWVHAQNETAGEKHMALAKRGAWVEFDGIGPETLARHAKLVSAMHAAGLVDRVLVSQDAGWYNVGDARGGKIRPFDFLLKEFAGALAAEGLGEDVYRKLVRDNPAKALAITKR